MAVRPETLDNPERGAGPLSTRDPAAEPAAEASRGPREHPAVAELRALRARLASLDVTPPPDRSPHCRDCYLRGVRATVKAAKGEP